MISRTCKVFSRLSSAWRSVGTWLKTYLMDLPVSSPFGPSKWRWIWDFASFTFADLGFRYHPISVRRSPRPSCGRISVSVHVRASINPNLCNIFEIFSNRKFEFHWEGFSYWCGLLPLDGVLPFFANHRLSKKHHFKTAPVCVVPKVPTKSIWSIWKISWFYLHSNRHLRSNL